MVLEEFSADSFEIRINNYRINEAVFGSEVKAVFMNSSILKASPDYIPNQFSLMQNYPNPFNPNTKIGFILPKKDYVNITIYDSRGKHIKSLINGYFNFGLNEIGWNSTNDKGRNVAAGVYIYKIQTSNYIETKKMILLK